MCINMELWDATKVYDRMGIDSEYTEILGIRVPVMTIPVKPGRNLAVIIEVGGHEQPARRKWATTPPRSFSPAWGMDINDLQGDEIRKDLENI